MRLFGEESIQKLFQEMNLNAKQLKPLKKIQILNTKLLSIRTFLFRKKLNLFRY